MIKCETCIYYVEADERNYPFCCMYCMTVDRVAMFNLCSFMEKDDNNKNENE